MHLVPGVYPLGADSDLNLYAALTRRLGSSVEIPSADLAFTSDDTLVYSVDPQTGINALLFVPAPTEAQIDAALTAIGIDPATASVSERALMRSLLKLKGGA